MWCFGYCVVTYIRIDIIVVFWSYAMNVLVDFVAIFQSVQEDQDWGFVAMVMDRLFLWLFMAASVCGTFVILCEAPSLYDNTKPIDTELSVIAQQIYNLTVK